MKKRKMTLKLGFMPTRRNMYGDKAFHPRAALQIKDRLEEWMKGKDIEYVNLDFLNEEGLLYHGRDADRVYTKFVEEKVDAVFCPHCNFGAEDAVAKAAKKIGKPLLLWGRKRKIRIQKVIDTETVSAACLLPQKSFRGQGYPLHISRTVNWKILCLKACLIIFCRQPQQ